MTVMRTKQRRFAASARGLCLQQPSAPAATQTSASTVEKRRRPSSPNGHWRCSSCFSLEAKRAQPTHAPPSSLPHGCSFQITEAANAAKFLPFARSRKRVPVAEPLLLLDWPLRCPAAANKRDFSDQMFSDVPLRPPSCSTLRLRHDSSVRHTTRVCAPAASFKEPHRQLIPMYFCK